MRVEGIKQLASSRWEVRVKRIEACTGKLRNRRTIVYGTRADAIRKRDEIRSRLANSSVRHQRIRLSTYAREWLARRVIENSTRDKYEYSLMHILPILGELFVDAIAAANVRDYVVKRIAEAAGNTVLNELRLLRAIARDSVADGIAERYWCDRVKAPKVARYDDDDPNLLTAEQGGRVLEHVPAQWLSLLCFIVTTGVRFGEASALRWEDLEHVAGGTIARIRRGNYRGTVTRVKTDGSFRNVPIVREVLAFMQEDSFRTCSNGLVFPTRRGTMHRGSPLRAVLAKACAAAGVPRVTTHGLRRTFNNEGRQVASKEVVKAITGHQTDAMFSHYSHVGAGEKAFVARAVAERLGVLKVSGARTEIEAK